MSKDKPRLQIPTFRIRLHDVFPETPDVLQNTGEALRPIASLVLLTAYLMAGKKPSLYEDEPIEFFFKDIENSCNFYGVDAGFVVRWADSLLVTPDETLPSDRQHLVPTHMKGKGWDLKPYQIQEACWFAHRMGGVCAMDPGLGKTATATAAAIGAKNNGKCNDSRCYIYCPVNAVEDWKPYCVDLSEHFKDVHIISIDSASNAANQALDRYAGGAIIVDELHKMKSDTSNRGDAIERLRHGFEWGIGLSGTFLNTGIEGVVRTQDIALPGLSRFTNLWTFGDAFDAIYEKTFEVGNGRKQTKKSVGMPPVDREADFNLYLSRGVRSLSVASTAVKDCVNIKQHKTIRIDDWAMPDWAKDLRKTLALADERNRVFWAPECLSDSAFTQYIAATAMALFEADPLKELPSKPKVFQELCREGRYDRVIALEYKHDTPRYNFVYNPSATFNADEPWTLPPGPKIQYLRNWLTTHPGQPVVIGAVSTNTVLHVAILLDSLGITYQVIDGTTKSKDRGLYNRQFEAGELQVMLLQQAAGAECITLTRSSVSMLVDHSWSANTYTQYTRRTYRITSKSDCEHHDLEFGRFQTKVVSGLIRGRAFDSRVRQELEAGFWDAGLLSRG